MRNFDEATITDAVLRRVRAAKDDRVRQVSEALVRHLHAFVREIEPTQAEWEFASMPAGTAADDREMAQPYYHLNYDFGLKANSGARRSGERAALDF